jgi:hypothetical protein
VTAGKNKKLLSKKDIVVTINEKEIIIPTIKLDKDHRVEIGGTLITAHKIQGKMFSGVRTRENVLPCIL